MMMVAVAEEVVVVVEKVEKVEGVVEEEVVEGKEAEVMRAGRLELR